MPITITNYWGIFFTFGMTIIAMIALGVGAYIGESKKLSRWLLNVNTGKFGRFGGKR